MKKVIIIIFICFSNMVFAQNNDTVFSGYKICDKGEYIIKNYYEFGKRTRSETINKETNKLEWEEIFDKTYYIIKGYYANGNLFSYKKNENDGNNFTYFEWYNNGTMKSKDCLIGSSSDSAIEWYQNGKIKSCIVRNKKRQFNGQQMFYYCNGQVGEKIEWRNGTLISAEAYDFKGDKIDIGSIKLGNGIFINHIISDSTYKPLSITTYKNGVANGIYYVLDEKGDTLKMAFTKNGLRNGISEEYKNGKLKSKGNYIADLLEGDLLYFNELGNVSYKEIYKNGIKTKTVFFENNVFDKIKKNIIKQYVLGTLITNPDSLIRNYFWNISVKFSYLYNHKPLSEIENINEMKKRLNQTNKTFDIYTYNEALKLKIPEFIEIKTGSLPNYYSYFTQDEVYIVKLADKVFYFFMEGLTIKSTTWGRCHPQSSTEYPWDVELIPFINGNYEDNYKDR